MTEGDNLKYTIKRWDNDAVIAEREGRSLADVILELVKECVSLDYAEINGAVFNYAIINGGKFAYVRFNDSAFNRSTFNRSEFNRSEFNDSAFNRSEFNDSAFNESTFNRSEFNDSAFNESTFNRSEFNRSEFNRSEFNESTFNRSAFNDSTFNRSAFNESTFNRSAFNESTFNDVNGLPVGVVVPSLHQKILAAISSDGCALYMGNWHTCETTHCRGGWDIQLAGSAGAELERQVGSWMAARLITLASCPWMTETPNFFASNEAALADIKACAEREIQEAANAH